MTTAAAEGGATEAVAAPPSGGTALCVFRYGGEPAAVSLGAVVGVVDVGRLVPLPSSPPRVQGLCALRREVITVVGPAGQAAGDAARVVVLVLKTAQGLWALRIGEAGTSVCEAEVSPEVPAASASGLTFLGSVRVGPKAVGVIDPEATWQALRAEVEGWYAPDRPREASPRGPGLADGGVPYPSV